MRNVPSAVWIDETGRIVRPTEAAGASDTYRVMDRDTGKIPPEAREDMARRRQLYYDALRDWVEKGTDSIYALSEEEVQARLRPPTQGYALAAANFRMGAFLYGQGRQSEAQRFFTEATKLRPENWNFWRQAWNLDESGSGRQDVRSVQETVGDIPFREPIDMPGME